MPESISKEFLHRRIDRLNKKQLSQVFGIIENYFRDKELSDEWKMLPPEVKSKIETGIKELDSGKGIPHQTAMKKIRSRYGRQKV